MGRFLVVLGVLLFGSVALSANASACSMTPETPARIDTTDGVKNAQGYVSFQYCSPKRKTYGVLLLVGYVPGSNNDKVLSRVRTSVPKTLGSRTVTWATAYVPCNFASGVDRLYSRWTYGGQTSRSRILYTRC